MNIVAHNLSAMNAQRQFGINTRSKAKSTEKLSSGYKINRAADDAAGLAISEKMRRQIRGLTQGVENTQDGISLCQVADGALAEVNDMLHRITELSVQSANGTNSEQDRQYIQEEIHQILQEIDKIGDTTTFNEQPLFKGNTISVANTLSAPKTNATSNVPNEDYIRESLNISGTPTGITKGTYTIDANSQGLTINGEAISWDKVKNANGNAIDENSIINSDYEFEYNGLTISFKTNADTTMEDVINAIAGTEFQVKEKSIQQDAVKISNIKVTPGTKTDDLLGGSPLVADKTLYIKADDDGISIMNYSHNAAYTQMTWAQMGINDWSNADGKSFNFFDSVTGVSFTGTIETNASKEDVIKSMNGINFKWDYIDRDTSSNTTLILEGIEVTKDGGTITNKLSDIKVSNMWFHHNLASQDFFKDMGYTTPSEIVDGVEINVSLTKNSANQLALKITSAKGNETIMPINSAKTSEFSQQGYKLVRFGGFSNSNEHFDILTTKTDVNSKNTLLEQYVGQDIATIKLPSPYKYSIIPNQVTNTEIYMSGFTTNQNNNTNPPVTPNPPITPNPPTPPNPDNVSNGELSLWIQSGTETGSGMYVTIDEMNTSILGLSDIDVSTEEGAKHVLDIIGGAIQQVSSNRAQIGAQQNRLEHIVASEENIVENTTAAESRIRDTDMAKEMVRYSNINILEQVGHAMMTQANQSNQGVLSLLS